MTTNASAPNIVILDAKDIADPEIRAMLQAFYSRSPMPILDRVADLGGKEDKIKAALKTYYIGYGHESIGDLGDTTLYIENCSMLAAKAFQATPLYRGQECSTRYIDFSTQQFYQLKERNGHRSETAANKYIEGWRSLYLRALTSLAPYVRRKYSREFVLPSTDMSEKAADAMYEKTLKAIIFDIARGLLPAAAMTSLAWTGSFREIRNHLMKLMRHPLIEVQDLSVKAWLSLNTRYPSTFEGLKDLQVKTDAYLLSEVENFYFKTRPEVLENYAETSLSFVFDDDFALYHDQVKQVRRGHPVPAYFAEMGQANITGSLDFASFRDLQRHRKGYMGMPMITSELGCHRWYLDQIYEADEALHDDVMNYYPQVNFTTLQPVDAQYLFPMMTKVPLKVKWDLGQLVYVVNLRSGVTVHPTLRKLVKDIVYETEFLPTSNIHSMFDVDKRLDYQATWRGDQDIVRKENQG